ncbi:MAG: MtnX-like HAD-IB family phosphatase [Candidatus Zixiibacteriota bacterium]
MRTVVFCDFDGTIATRDVGYSLFKHFSNGENARLIPDWKAGILSSRDCLRMEAAMVKAPPSEVIRFLDQFEIDPGFAAFELTCRQQNAELIVLSDGLDFYIRHILEKFSLHHLPVRCNIGLLHDHGLTVQFPNLPHTCRRCGTCKGEQIDTYRAQLAEPCRAVFVGDGYSDVCAARAADHVLAKKDLEQYCLRQKIPYTKYHDFFDVARLLVEHGYLAR